MTPGLFSILTKHAAALQPKPDHQEILDKTFGSHEQSRWRDFRRATRSKAFVNALKTDERADDKMKRYADAMYLHFAGGRKGETFTVPGKQKNYTVKFHAAQDKFTCSCPDWGYARSHQTNKGQQDCKHIKMVKLELAAQGGKPKLAVALGALASTVGNFSRHDRYSDQAKKEKLKVRAYKSVFAPS